MHIGVGGGEGVEGGIKVDPPFNILPKLVNKNAKKSLEGVNPKGGS
jgi:hypothetical protein